MHFVSSFKCMLSQKTFLFWPVLLLKNLTNFLFDKMLSAGQKVIFFQRPPDNGKNLEKLLTFQCSIQN